MSADNLPRPSTPGPWEAYGDDVLATYRGRIETLAMLDGDGTDDPVADAEAIAALPERIRRMDAVRGYAQTAVDLGRMFGDASMERVGTDVLRLLNGDGEAGE